MDLCKYSGVVSCKECDVTYHLNCDKFCKAHAAFLTKELRPFRFKKVISPKTKIVWSDDIDKIKSACSITSLNLNMYVKKLTSSQALSLAINSSDPIDFKIVFIECSQKASGDLEKISSCLKSFIESLSYSGTYVYLYVSPRTMLNFKEYHKL